MCQFFSALALRNGDVLSHEATGSHADLVAWFGLPDDRDCRHFAKVEFRPDDAADLADVSKYVLCVDEDTVPSWWPEVYDQVQATCAARARRMIDERAVLLGGCWILADGVRARTAKASRIIAMFGPSRVDAMCDASQVLRAYPDVHAPRPPKQETLHA